MRNYTLVLFTALLLVTSCKPLQFSAIPIGTSLEERIPPLEPEFDHQSFRINYPELYRIPADIISGRPPSVGTIVNNMSTEFIIAEDTERIFQREIIQNVCQRTGETKGYAVCRQGIRSTGIKSWVNPLVSAFTLFIPNLFGYTFKEVVDELEVVVDIYDNDNKVVASYTGMGYGSAKVKMYNGYRDVDAKRLAHGIAFVDALEAVKHQMVQDSKEIVALLD